MRIVLAFVSALALVTTAYAQSGASHDAHHSGDSPSAKPSEVLTEGEVRKVDKDSGKLTIKHGEIRNLEMPPMTMVFRVKDLAMLEQVKPGDKVRFEAQKVDGLLTVTRIQGEK